MKDEIKKPLHMNIISDFEFNEICGFTIVFERKITEIKGEVQSGEIEPIGIIYDENGEYYFAPLVDNVDNLNVILQEFVETQLK